MIRPIHHSLNNRGGANVMDSTFIKKYLACAADIMEQEKELLINLDSVVGDGDLGLTMSDGFAAASIAIKDSEEHDCGKLLYLAGKAMSTAVPSTMGTLMASGLMAAGKVLKGKQELENNDVLIMFTAYEEGVIHRGKARIGDKTFLDGLHPGIEALQDKISIHSLQDAAAAAYAASEKGYESTLGMLAIHGRAAARGEKSRELKDPGAYVGMLLMKALCDCLE